MAGVLETGSIPGGWTESWTVMLSKTSKPKVRELRAIALTNVAYKLMMAVIRSTLQQHIRRN